MITWKPIVGYEGLYEVSSIGLIRTIKRSYKTGEYGQLTTIEQKYMKFKVDDDGYYYLGLRKNGVRSYKRVNRIVCEAFHPNPENKRFVNHKDGIKKNNEAENVEWSTSSENELHSYRVLNKKQVGAKPLYQFDLTGRLINIWQSMEQALKAGYGKRCIRLVLMGKQSHHRGFFWSRQKVA